MAAVFRRPKTHGVLWVEGKDDLAVVQSLFAAHQLPDRFRVHATNGVDALLATLGLELRDPNVKRFGLVVDANGDSAARCQAVRHVLLAEGYPAVPDLSVADGVVVPGSEDLPRFGAWIMPDNASPGALENFAAAMIPPTDVLLPHAVRVVETLPERRFSPAHQSKAVIHTWLAWQAGPGSPMGQAIGKGNLDANAPAARRFVDWVRRLMLDDEPGAVQADE